MDINSAFPSNYLKAADLQNRDVTVTMREVRMEELGGDHKPILYFQNKDRGLVLNKTNSTNICALYGAETDRWPGNQITLYKTLVDYQGRTVDAIRVKAPQFRQEPASPPAQQPAPQETQHADQAGAFDDEIPF